MKNVIIVNNNGTVPKLDSDKITKDANLVYLKYNEIDEIDEKKTLLVIIKFSKINLLKSYNVPIVTIVPNNFNPNNIINNNYNIIDFIKLPIDIKQLSHIIKNEFINNKKFKSKLEIEDKHIQLSNSISDWIWDIDTDLNITESSKNTFSFIGYNPNELIGKHLPDLVDKKNTHIFKSRLKRITNNNKLIDSEIWYKTKEESYVCMLTCCIPILKENRIIGYRGICKDITDRKLAEEHLFTTIERLHVATTSGQIGIWEWDIADDVLIWDKPMYEIYEVDKDPVGIKDWLKLIHPVESEKIKSAFFLNFNKTNTSKDFRILTLFHGVKHIHCTATTIYDLNNQPIKMIGINIDITRLKKAEEDIKRSEKRLRVAQSLAKLGNWELLIENKSLYWSDELYNIFEIEDKKITYNKYISLIDKHDREMVTKRYEQHLKDKKNYEIDYMIKTENGNLKYVRHFYKTIYSETGFYIKSLGTIQDVSDKKITEIKINNLNKDLEERVINRTKELEIEKNFSESVINSLPGIFFAFDAKGKLLRVNNNYKILTGLTDENFNKHGIVDFVKASDRKKLEKRLKSDKNIESIEVYIKSKNNECIPYYLTISKVVINKKRYNLGIGLDITDQKKKTMEIKRLSQAIEQSPASVVISDKDGIITYVNNSFLNISGYKYNEVIGQKTSILKSGEMDSQFYKNLWVTITTGKKWHGELKNKKKNGELFWEFVSISPIFDENYKITSYVGVKEDITQRKLQEKNLKIRADRLTKQSRLFTEITEGDELTELGLKHGLNVILFTTKKALELEKASIWVYNENKINADCISSIGSKRVELLTKTKSKNPEYFNKSKELIIEEDQLFIPIWFRGERFGVLKLVSSVGFSHKEDISFIRSITGLISLVKESDARREAQHIAEEATKTKSEFIANMSHEIRTPMNAIIGLSHLMSKGELNKKQRDYINKISNASNNLLRIINDILDFSKIEAGKLTLEKTYFNLNSVIEEVIKVIEVSASQKKLELFTYISEDVPEHLYGDPLRLSQVLLNLTGNAVKFTAKGSVSIYCDLITIDKDEARLNFSIKDTGIGLDDTEKSRLFESFTQADSSTTRKYGGTGLGLTISKNLIELMGGTISVKSRKNQGSTFSFTSQFPYTIKSLESEISTIKDYRVLIADNNKEKVDLLAKELYNLDITIVNSGHEAISYFLINHGEKKHPYSLILINNRLESINGLETIRQIRKLKKLQQPPIILYGSNSSLNTDKLDELNITILKANNLTKETISGYIIDTFQKEKKVTKATKKIDEQKLKGSILLVEDNILNQQIIIDLLEDESIKIETANNGIEALESIKNNKYDIVLMDLHMPKMDGITASKKIREELNYKELPIIAMTADAMTGVNEKVEEAGMNGYITKPININSFFSTINKYLQIEGNISSQSEDIIQIELIDATSGINRFNGKVENYLKTLKKFTKQKDTINEINTHFSNKNKEFLEVIHRLKGVSGNISAYDIFNLCKSIENEYKNNNMNKVKKLLSMLNSQFFNTIANIEEFFSKYNENNNDIKNREKNENYDIKSQLEILKDYIMENNLKSLEITEALSRNTKGSSYEKLIKRVLEQLENYDFEEALNILNKNNTNP